VQLTINITAVLISFAVPLLGMQSPLSITQILWINLVMDTLAALAFGGEPALREFMLERPKRRDENIISKAMWSQILTAAIWVFGVSLFFLLSPWVREYFRPHEADRYLYTGYFTFFIFAAVFNMFNARTTHFNLFDNITKNSGFIKVVALIAVVQITIVTFAGDILRAYGLTMGEWALVFGLAFLVVPIDLLRKYIVSRSNLKNQEAYTKQEA